MMKRCQKLRTELTASNYIKLYRNIWFYKNTYGDKAICRAV